MTFLSTLYKLGDRTKLRATNSTVFGAVSEVSRVFEEFEDEKQRDSHIQKLVTKLAGRIALVELKPRAAKWRYNRGSRILGVARRLDTDEKKIDEQGGDEHVEVSEVVEEVIGLLLNALSDSATVVRWNAAKPGFEIMGLYNFD